MSAYRTSCLHPKLKTCSTLICLYALRYGTVIFIFVQIPDYLKIDEESQLLGSMKPYKRHVLFQIPGKSWNNWSPKIEEQEGSLASQVVFVSLS